MRPASGRFVWAISGVCRFNVRTCRLAVRKEKYRRLTANFAHAQPRPLWTDCNQILRVESGGWCDYWCQFLWKSVEGLRSYRTSPHTLFPVLNVHRPYNSVSTTVLHCDSIFRVTCNTLAFVIKVFRKITVTILCIWETIQICILAKLTV